MLRTIAMALALNVALAVHAPAPASAQGKSKEAKSEQVKRAHPARQKASQSKAPKGAVKAIPDRNRGLTTMPRNPDLERDRDARDRDRDEWERQRRDRDWDRRDRDRDWERDVRAQRNGRGPKFCRTGEGHPVHGRQWCVQKGFGLGQGSWRTTRWDDAIFRRRDNTGSLSSGGLADVLGSVIFNRLTNRAQVYGHRQPLSGQWLDGYDGSRTMLVTSGRVPFAELVDRNGDGRVDIVLLNVAR